MHGLGSGPAAPAPAQLDAVQQKRGGPTPTASQESPPKRARVTDVHQLAEHVDMSNVQLADRKPLRALPTSLLLLARAQLHYASLKRSQLPLTLPVSPANAHATNYASYLEQLGAIVLSLKAVIASSRTSSGDLAAGRIELRARCQLVEILIREMDNSSGRAGPSGSSGEVEEIIAKGLAAANKHGAFLEFRYHLESLSAEHSLSLSLPKFAKSTLKRSITSLLAPSTLTHPQYLYNAHLTLSAIATGENDYPSSLFHLREVEKLAKSRGDSELYWSIRVLVGRLALGQGEWSVVLDVVQTVGEVTGVAVFAAGDAKGKAVRLEAPPHLKDQGLLGRQLKIQFLILFCLYQAQMGNVKLAKEKLKLAHSLLDEKDAEPGEMEGWVLIGINPAGDGSGTSAGAMEPRRLHVMLATTPRQVMYAFAFLVSAAVHRDPFGTKPRAKLFATEGLRVMNKMLFGQEGTHPTHLPLVALKSSLVTLAKMKISLLLFTAELDILRSSFKDALESINLAIAECRAHKGLWDASKMRILLAMGSLNQGTFKDQLALECFEGVVRSVEDRARVRTMDGGDEQGLLLLARVSILVIKIGQGSRVRIGETTSSPSINMARSTSSSSASKFGSADPSTPATPHDSSLATLTRSILALTGASPLPAFQILGEFIKALTSGEIIKAKQFLSNSLNLANGLMSNHCKALMLALLANLFLWTRNDQAQKMLVASFTILRGMGSRVEDVNGNDKDNIVGNAKLGLWVGERLLESYQREGQAPKAKRQESYNAAHRAVLAREFSL